MFVKMKHILSIKEGCVETKIRINLKRILYYYEISKNETKIWTTHNDWLIVNESISFVDNAIALYLRKENKQ